MNTNYELYQTNSEYFVAESNNCIEELERKRVSYPKPRLTSIEREVLTGLAQGRSMEELDNAIRLYSKKKSYHTIVRSLFKKFEAFTLSHVVYKALKVGILK